MVQACERNYLKQVRNNTLTDNTKFAYAWHLIKSQYSSDVRKGITMMQGEFVRVECGVANVLVVGNTRGNTIYLPRRCGSLTAPTPSHRVRVW